MNDETALALRTLAKILLETICGNILMKLFSQNLYRLLTPCRLSERGQKVIAFGDFSNYWLVQRFPMTIRTLRELFAVRGQVGYLGCEYLDGKLIRKDAVKVLQMAAD